MQKCHLQILKITSLNNLYFFICMHRSEATEHKAKVRYRHLQLTVKMTLILNFRKKKDSDASVTHKTYA